MAKTIATVSGVALAPGVSRNGRLYTREAIAKAVSRAQGRIADGGEPLTMLTYHEAGGGDDSTAIVGRLTSLTLGENGEARFAADIADTPPGRTIATLLDTSDGKPAFLRGVSIRGAWAGKVRRENTPGGPVETSSDLELDGLDYTRKPGVGAAAVDTFAWAKDGTTETDERVPIIESVQEARVTVITEETAPVTEAMPAGVREATRDLLFPASPHILENGICATCAVTEATTVPISKRDSGVQGTGGPYADPGYQADKKQRYQLDTAAHAKAAWAFINQAKNAKAYTAAQIKRIKGRIKVALKKFGVTVANEGWTVDPAIHLTEAVAEFYGGDPECAGSYSLTATNGPTTVTVCSYGLDPADLAVILQKACDGAGMALCALDPDMDGDIDVPGADAEDTDSDMGSGDSDGDGIDDLATRLAAAMRGESTEDIGELVAEARKAGQVSEAAASQDPAPDAGPNPREEPAVSEATTTEAVATPAAPAVSQDVINAAVAQALAADKEARKARKAARAKPAESAPAAPVTEAATETADERVARLVDEAVAKRLAESGAAPVAETEDERIERLVSERLVAEKQTTVANGGGPGRKGLVTEHSAARASGEIPADFPMKDGVMKPMEQWTEDERRASGAALQQHVLGDRAVY